MYYKFEYTGFALIEAGDEAEAREKWEFEDFVYAGKQVKTVQVMSEEEASVFVYEDASVSFCTDMVIPSVPTAVEERGPAAIDLENLRPQRIEEGQKHEKV